MSHAVVSLASGLRVCVTAHAKQRMAEMRVAPDAAARCLSWPERVTPQGGKYEGRGRFLHDRGELTLVVTLCRTSGTPHLCLLTALPRTQEKWCELAARGDLGPGRDLRPVSHLPTRDDLHP